MRARGLEISHYLLSALLQLDESVCKIHEHALVSEHADRSSAMKVKISDCWITLRFCTLRAYFIDDIILRPINKVLININRV